MRRLAYNQVWEDYDVDRAALDIGPADRVFMITSAGCNVLNTLTESPARIVTVDSNADQHALLARKLSVIRDGDHRALWREFGAPAQRRRASIYGRGAYSRFRWVRAYMHAMCGTDSIRAFTRSRTLGEQRHVYMSRIEPRLWNPATRAMPAFVAGVCGMHWRQVASTFRGRRFRLESVCRDRMRAVLTRFPIRENYYWHQMLTGRYASRLHCPPYLRESEFPRVRALASRIESHTADALDFLRAAPAHAFTRVSLLDVPEFLSPARREALFGELRRVCAPGARIVYRSFAPDLPVPPAHNGGAPFRLRRDEDASAFLTARERTASYAAVHVYSLMGGST